MSAVSLCKETSDRTAQQIDIIKPNIPIEHNEDNSVSMAVIRELSKKKTAP